MIRPLAVLYQLAATCAHTVFASQGSLMSHVKDLTGIKRVYLIGICGTAMASLAGMLQQRGYEVGGMDYFSKPFDLKNLAANFPFRLNVTNLPLNTGCPVGMNWAITQGRAPVVAASRGATGQATSRRSAARGLPAGKARRPPH